jgi:hypothetical protein
LDCFRKSSDKDEEKLIPLGDGNFIRQTLINSDDVLEACNKCKTGILHFWFVVDKDDDEIEMHSHCTNPKCKFTLCNNVKSPYKDVQLKRPCAWKIDPNVGAFILTTADAQPLPPPHRRTGFIPPAPKPTATATAGDAEEARLRKITEDLEKLGFKETEEQKRFREQSLFNSSKQIYGTGFGPLEMEMPPPRTSSIHDHPLLGGPRPAPAPPSKKLAEAAAEHVSPGPTERERRKKAKYRAKKRKEATGRGAIFYKLTLDGKLVHTGTHTPGVGTVPAGTPATGLRSIDVASDDGTGGQDPNSQTVKGCCCCPHRTFACDHRRQAMGR